MSQLWNGFRDLFVDALEILHGLFRFIGDEPAWGFAIIALTLIVRILLLGYATWLGIELVPLYFELDGSFPNHHPDPTVAANLKQLQDTVLREGCDLGIAFDGDGDRVGLVDAQARILWGDQILLFLAQDVLKRHPGATIIGDVKCSEALFDGIAAAGGKPLDVLVREKVTGPLGMTDTHFFQPESQRARFAEPVKGDFVYYDYAKPTPFLSAGGGLSSSTRLAAGALK